MTTTAKLFTLGKAQAVRIPARFRLNADEVEALISFSPIRNLTSDNTYLLDRDHSVANGDFVYESQVLRTKVNYQLLAPSPRASSRSTIPLLPTPPKPPSSA